MTSRSRNSDPPPVCEKWGRSLRSATQDKYNNNGVRKPTNGGQFQEKLSSLSARGPPMRSQRQRTPIRNQSPSNTKPLTTTVLYGESTRGEHNASPVSNVGNGGNRGPPQNSRHHSCSGGTLPTTTNGSKAPRFRHRSMSSCDSDRADSWGQLLMQNRSRETVSTFNGFDPLRTLHFLSKELHFKLQCALPDDSDVHQMVLDIQHALKRIPPEVASLIHLQQSNEFIPPHTRPSGGGGLKGDDSGSEKSTSSPRQHHHQVQTATKMSQTPPTLYQEDTEKFQKIMEENAQKLEISLRQLELVCSKLQTEKDDTEKELVNARKSIQMLCGRIKELEHEITTVSNLKIKRLEEDRARLQLQVDNLGGDTDSSHLKLLVDQLRQEKIKSDQSCARLEYDLTLVNMEKEKFVTMLAVRDREIKEIQEEMSRIQEQVSKELKRLNGQVLSRASSIKSLATGSVNLNAAMGGEGANGTSGVGDGGNKQTLVEGGDNVEGVTSQKVTGLEAPPVDDLKDNLEQILGAIN